MIICCGEALIDMIRTQIPDFGEVYIPKPGGSSYNTAIAIGKMGIPVKFLGIFSTDSFGDMLIKKLRASRVGDDLIIRSDRNTSLAFVTPIKGKEPHYTFYTEGNTESGLEMENLPKTLPENTRCILFGTISITMEPIASTIESLVLLEGSKKSADRMDGAPVISFDPNVRPFKIKDLNTYISRFEKSIAASTIVKLSSRDFDYIYPDLDKEKALQKILTMGPRLAICTLGTKGAIALLRKNDGNITRVRVPAIKVPVLDTIGAGDTFHGALLSWLEIKKKMSRSALVSLSENELYQAILFANKAAAIVCSRQGAVPPSRKEAEALKSPMPITK